MYKPSSPSVKRVAASRVSLRGDGPVSVSSPAHRPFPSLARGKGGAPALSSVETSMACTNPMSSAVLSDDRSSRIEGVRHNREASNGSPGKNGRSRLGSSSVTSLSLWSRVQRSSALCRPRMLERNPGTHIWIEVGSDSGTGTDAASSRSPTTSAGLCYLRSFSLRLLVPLSEVQILPSAGCAERWDDDAGEDAPDGRGGPVRGGRCAAGGEPGERASSQNGFGPSAATGATDGLRAGPPWRDWRELTARGQLVSGGRDDARGPLSSREDRNESV